MGPSQLVSSGSQRTESLVNEIAVEQIGSLVTRNHVDQMGFSMVET